MIAAATLEITPNRALPLAGYAGRGGESQSIHDRLEANILLMDQVALIQIDTLFSSEALEQRIRHYIGGNLDLLLVASHTHFAPSLDPTKPALGECDLKFLDEVAEKIGRRINEEHSFVSGNIRLGIGSASDLSINRRSKRLHIARKFPFFFKDIVIQPNRSGPADPAVHTFVVEHNRNPVAVIWHYACHPVGFPQINDVSADFIGVVRQRIRHHFHKPDLPVIFLQGFSGDVTPNVINSHPHLKERIKYPHGELFGNFTMESFNKWSNALGEVVVNTFKTGTPLPTSSVFCQSSIDISSILPHENGKLKLAALSFGSDLNIIFAGAEVVQSYIKMIQSIFNGITLGVGYTGPVFGYLPTDKHVREGGYESEGFIEPFGLRGSFSSGIEELVKNKFENMARDLSELKHQIKSPHKEIRQTPPSSI